MSEFSCPKCIILESPNPETLTGLGRHSCQPFQWCWKFSRKSHHFLKFSWRRLKSAPHNPHSAIETQLQRTKLRFPSHTFNFPATISGFHPNFAEIKRERGKNMKVLAAPSASSLNSPFLYCPLKLSSSSPFSAKSLKNQRSPLSYPCIRAADLDQNTVNYSILDI